MFAAWRAAVALHHVESRRTVIGAAVVGVVGPTFPTPRAAAAKPPSNRRLVWDFANGHVMFNVPFTVCDGTMSFDTMELLGSGGGGAVFVASSSSSSKAPPSVVVKVSWMTSSESVQQECLILQRLTSKGISEHVEQCLEVQRYSFDPTRTVAILQPAFLDDQVSSIADIPNPIHQRRAVRALVETSVRMITQAQVVTTDVQVLISKQSGDLLWIDFTEAIAMQVPPTFADLAVANGMLNEVSAMVPEKLKPFALECILGERKKLDAEEQPSYISGLMDNFQDLNEQ